jgi:sortase B
MYQFSEGSLISINYSQKGKKTRVFNILLFIFIVNLATACIYFAIYYYKLYKNETMYEKLRILAVEDEKFEKDNSGQNKTEINENIRSGIDFHELKKTNNDIYAWICIPDTGINYPILQHPTDNQYYLQHNIDGNKGYPGCIYSEKCNQKDFTDKVTVLYGHNMKNGTMFGSLHKYNNTKFFKKHRYIYVFTPEQSLVYEILLISEYDNRHIMEHYDLQKKEGIISLMNSIVCKTNQKERMNAAIDSNNHFLILSTCTKSGSSKRLLVISKETGL